MAPTRDTRYERLKHRIENYRVLSFALLGVAAVVSLAAFTDSLSSLATRAKSAAAMFFPRAEAKVRLAMLAPHAADADAINAHWPGVRPSEGFYSLNVTPKSHTPQGLLSVSTLTIPETDDSFLPPISFGTEGPVFHNRSRDTHLHGRIGSVSWKPMRLALGHGNQISWDERSERQ